MSFDHIGGGLVTRDGKPPTWFEIAGTDGVYQPADAKISADGKWILLTNAAVAKPDRARFAWSQIAEPNLMNKEDFPPPPSTPIGRRIRPLAKRYPEENPMFPAIPTPTAGTAA